jgi:hypothetical protein
MTSVLRDLPDIGSEKCLTCQGFLSFRMDAIGRVVARCYTCRGPAVIRPAVIAKRAPAIHPSWTGGYVLPEIGEGEVRCQVCAHGIVLPDRYCGDCLRMIKRKNTRARSIRPSAYTWKSANYKAQVCRGCQKTFKPDVGHRQYCQDCAVVGEVVIRRAHGRVYPDDIKRFPYRPCAGCKAPVLRTRGRPKRDCDACRVAR